jgi:hypothetical protein
MSGFLARTALALAIVTLCACVSSTNPAGPESAAVEEKGLIGSWQYVGDKDDVWSFVHVLPLSGNRLQIVAVNSLRSDWAVLSGYVTPVGPGRVINAKLVASSDAVKTQVAKDSRPDHPYSFIAYRLESKDRLVVSMPAKALQIAVKSGKLAGEATNAGIFVADESAKIATALGAASDADVFAQTLVYRRIATP